MTRLGLLLAPVLLLASCSDQPHPGPPTVHLGDSLCEHCGMIISDERFVSATVVQGPRGSEARLFDDFNCQIEYELSHADLTVKNRWARDHDTVEWIRASDATFLSSPRLRTPMASKVAAFASASAARNAQEELDGTLLQFDELRSHFAGN